MESVNGQYGVELIDALAKAGGLPTIRSTYYGPWAGELRNLNETRRGARKLARDNKLYTNLFRDDAVDVDQVVSALREQGFQFETPGDLFDALDTRLRTGQGQYAFKDNAEVDVPFSQQQLPKTDATQRAETIAKRAYKEAGIREVPKLVAVESAADLQQGPAAVEVRTATERGNVVEAFYNTATREVVLVLDGVRQVAEARGVSVNQRIAQLALHEVTHHFGALGTLFTGKSRMSYNQIVEGVLARMQGQELQQLADLYKLDLNSAADRAKLAEEHLARVAEQPGKLPDWASRVIAKVRDLLRRLYPNLKFSDADVRELLRAARRRLQAVSSTVTGSNLTLSQQPAIKERGFITSAKGSPSVDDEVKAKINGFYQVFTDKAAIEQAKEYINQNGLDASLVAVLDNNAPGKLSNTIGIDLIGRLQALNRHADATKLVEHIAANSTTQAQAIQALHLLSRLDATGVQVFAQRQIEGAIKDNPELQELRDQLRDLQAEFERVSKRNATSAILDVQDMLKSLKLEPAKLSELNTRFREILLQSSTDPGIALPRLVGMLMGQANMSRVDATRLANKVLNQYRSAAKKARERALKELLKVPKPELKIDKGLIGKWQALNETGALDDATLFEQIAKARKLPLFTRSMAEKVKAMQAEYAAAPEGPVKLTKGAKMLEAIYDQIPANFAEKMRTWQVLALLLNPKTAIRNVTGNVVQLASDVAADTLAVIPDRAVRLLGGKSTGVGPKLRERASGLLTPVRDFQAGYSYGKEQGLDTRGAFSEGMATMLGMAKLTSAGKFDLNQVNEHQRHIFSSQFMRMLEDTLQLTLGVFDRAFHQSAYNAWIARQMDAAKANGQELLAPTREMAELAMFKATQAVYQNDTFLSKGLNAIGKGLNLVSTLGTTDKFGLGSAVITFAKVPSNIVIEASRWTPLGFLQTLYRTINPGVKGLGQAELIDGLTRAVAGSVALLGTGYFLAKLGILTAAPEDDKDLEAMRKASGMGAYSLNLSALKRAMLSGNWWTPQPQLPGDVVTNYNWLQPTAVPVSVGAQIAIETSKGNVPGSSLAVAALKGAGRSLEDLPVLTGIARLASNWAYNGPIAGTAQTVVTGVPSSMVPTLLRQAGDLGDNQVRETRGGTFLEREVNSIASRLPGLAQNYPPRYDIFGVAQERYQYGTNTLFNVLLNPAFVNKVKASPLLHELDRIYAATGNASVVPPAQQRAVQVNGQKLELTNDQLSDMQQYTGQLANVYLNRLMATPQFAQWNDNYKAAFIAQRLTEIQGAAKIQLLGQKPMSLSPMGNVTANTGAVTMLMWARANGLPNAQLSEPAPPPP